MFRKVRWLVSAVLAVAALAMGSMPAQAQPITKGSFEPGTLDRFRFDMVRSAGIVKAGCLPNARAVATLTRLQQNNRLTVEVAGMPANVGLVLFVTQLPNAPFGVSWYQGDFETNANGYARVSVQGIFNAETFSLSPDGPEGGADPTQDVTGKARVDTDAVLRPTNQFHLGIWFDSPEDAAAAGCPGATTPFNGTQDAGVQALNTANFDNNLGPLAAIRP